MANNDSLRSNSSNSNNMAHHTPGWFGMMDRLCGCSYIDAQLCAEQETFGGRSTTIPTSWMKEDSASPIIPRHHPPGAYPSNTITPPDSPQSSWATNPPQYQYHHPAATTTTRYYESPVWKEAPSSPTSTATTVTMRTRSVASVDTTKTIPRQRTNSSLATVYHPQPGPNSFRRSQSYASSAGGDSIRHLHHYRYPSNDESDLFHSKVLVSVAFDDDEYNDHDHSDDQSSAFPLDRVSTTAATAGSKAFHRPRALRRVQTDSLTQLPPLAVHVPKAMTTTEHNGRSSNKRR